MGYDINCHCTLGKQSAEGKAQLETDFILFRSDAFRFKITLTELKTVVAKGEFLELEWPPKNKATLRLGEKDATRWAGKILNPPTRADKLGIKPESKIYLEGELDPEFTQSIYTHRAPAKQADLIFLAADDKAALLKAPALAKQLKPKAALWIVYPKGRPEIREIDVLTAGRAAGLKDVKVVRFSDTDTALKFVAPSA